jgi:hypothetical protein
MVTKPRDDLLALRDTLNRVLGFDSGSSNAGSIKRLVLELPKAERKYAVGVVLDAVSAARVGKHPWDHCVDDLAILSSLFRIIDVHDEVERKKLLDAIWVAFESIKGLLSYQGGWLGSLTNLIPDLPTAVRKSAVREALIVANRITDDNDRGLALISLIRVLRRDEPERKVAVRSALEAKHQIMRGPQPHKDSPEWELWNWEDHEVLDWEYPNDENNLDKEFIPDTINPADTRDDESQQISRQNDRTLTNEISDDQLLIELKNRGISSTLIQGVAAELVQRSDDRHSLPEMDEDDLRQLAEQTRSHRWSAEAGKSPSEFISDVYKKWLGKKRLMREHFPKDARKLIAAYATEIRRHPERRLKDLGERPHTRYGASLDSLPASPSTWIPTAVLSEEQREHRRRAEAQRQRKRSRKIRPRGGKKSRTRGSSPSP